MSPLPPCSRRSSGTAARIAHIFADLANAWNLRQARHAMGQLDDAALHDLGVDRGDIEAAVRHGRRALRG